MLNKNDIIKKRLENFRILMDKNKLDAFILFVFEGANSENCHYISGFRGSSAALIIAPNEALLITDGRYRTQAPEQAKNFKIIVQSEMPLVKFVTEYLKNLKLKNIGYEAGKISHRLFETFFAPLNNDFNWIDATDLIPGLRRTKDAYEVGAIKEAARIARVAYGRVLDEIKNNALEITESDFSIRLLSEIKKMGAEGGWSGHDFIVASGLNGAMCHARATQKKFNEGDIVTVDYGAMTEGYMSDVTRNFAIKKADKKALEINKILLQAHRDAAAALRPGISGKEVDAIARKIIDDAGYGKDFAHGLGHGLGLEVHEAPRLSQTSKDILQIGDVVTIEPGIYLEDWGGLRIEDDYLITESGAECLTINDNQSLEII